jgi:hypothetical protein
VHWFSSDDVENEDGMILLSKAFEKRADALQSAQMARTYVPAPGQSGFNLELGFHNASTGFEFRLRHAIGKSRPPSSSESRAILLFFLKTKDPELEFATPASLSEFKRVEYRRCSDMLWAPLSSGLLMCPN